MAWSNTNATKTPATVAWADETRAAIVAYDGIGTTAAAGVTVTFDSSYSTVDSYAVFFSWQEDPGVNSGDLYAVKSVGSCIIKNKGTGYGKKFAYRVVPVIDP